MRYLMPVLVFLAMVAPVLAGTHDEAPLTKKEARLCGGFDCTGIIIKKGTKPTVRIIKFKKNGKRVQAVPGFDR